MTIADLKVFPALGNHPPTLIAELILATLALDLIEAVLTANVDFTALRTLGVPVRLVVADCLIILSHSLFNIFDYLALLGTYLVGLFPAGP